MTRGLVGKTVDRMMKKNKFSFGSLSFRPEGIKVEMLSRQLEVIIGKLRWYLER